MWRIWLTISLSDFIYTQKNMISNINILILKGQYQDCWCADINHMTWWLSARLQVTTVLQKAINTLRPRQNGRHFTDDTFKRIFLNENIRILIKLSLKSVPKGPINNIPAMVQIMAWHRPGDKPLSEPMVISLPTHICVARPQWGDLNQILDK